MGKKKILLIEDDPDNAFLITEELEMGNAGNEVVLKKDGQEVMDYLNEMNKDTDNELTSQIELILLDLDLPKINGMEILKFLKRSDRFHSIPVVILSTITDQSTIEEACKNGANGFITKSISNYDNEFVRNVRLLRDYCKSRLIEDFTDRVDNEAQFEDKCKELIDDTVRRSRKVKDLSNGIMNESVAGHSTDVIRVAEENKSPKMR